MNKIIQNKIICAIKNDALIRTSISEEPNCWNLFINALDIIYGERKWDEPSLNTYLLFLSSNKDCIYNMSYFLNEIHNFMKFRDELQKQFDQFIQFAYFLHKNLSDFVGLNIIINECVKLTPNRNHLFKSEIELLTSDIKILRKHTQKFLLQLEFLNETDMNTIFYTKEYANVEDIDINEISICKQLYKIH